MRAGHEIARGETPASIARDYTGDPLRFRELVIANPALPCPGGTFAALVEGQLVCLPDSWMRELELEGFGLGDLPLANGLPDSNDVVNQGVQTGTTWLLAKLGIAGGAANVAAAIAAVPVGAFAVFAADTVAVGAVNTAATGVLTVLSTIAPELASSVAEVIGTALDVVPVLGAALDAASAIGSVVAALESPPSFSTEGPNGIADVPVSQYVSTNIPIAVNDAPKYLTMAPADFAIQETISVNDLMILSIGGTDVLVWGTPLLPGGAWNDPGFVTIVPGAWSLLHAVQLSAAAATAPLMANRLADYVGVTGPATLPLVTTAEWSQIFSLVLPLHDAIVASAQAWADAQSPAPTAAAIAAKYGLDAADTAAIVAAYKPGGAAKTSTATVIAGTALGAGALGAAIAFGVAAYKGVSVVTVAHDWWSKVKRAVT